MRIVIGQVQIVMGSVSNPDPLVRPRDTMRLIGCVDFNRCDRVVWRPNAQWKKQLYRVIAYGKINGHLHSFTFSIERYEGRLNHITRIVELFITL